MTTTGHRDYQPTLRDRAATEMREIADEVGKIRIVDFVFGFFMIFVGINVAGLPLGTLAAGGIAFIALTRKSSFLAPRAGTFTVLMVLSILFATAESFLFGVSTNGQIIRRVVRLLIIVTLVLVIADRRIHLKSLLFGITTALVFNVLAFYAGLAPDTYGGYLTGFLNDKNQSGLWYAIIGLLLLIHLGKKNHRIIAVLAFGSFVFLTGSRTSLAAFAFGLLWFVIARFLNLVAKIGLGAAVVWAVDYVTENFAESPIFGDRSGSDALRQRIDDASQAKIDQTPWSGLGYGQATVELEGGRTFFFHNSFWTLIVEGGYLYMLAVVALMILAVFVWKQPRQKSGGNRQVAGEAAMVLIFICSWRLGEVLLTVPWALAVGLALHYLSTRPTDQNPLREAKTIWN